MGAGGTPEGQGPLGEATAAVGRYPWLLHPGASPAVALASEALRDAAGVWVLLSPHTPSLAPGPLLRFQHHADPLPRAFICAVLEAWDRALWPIATASGRSPGRSSHQATPCARAPEPSCGHGALGCVRQPAMGQSQPQGWRQSQHGRALGAVLALGTRVSVRIYLPVPSAGLKDPRGQGPRSCDSGPNIRSTVPGSSEQTWTHTHLTQRSQR